MATRIASTPTQLRTSAAYAVVALALGACLAFELTAYGLGGWHALFFALAPDLAFLYGVAPGLSKGQLHPRAVWLYNALHSFFGPITLATAAALNMFGLDLAWFVGALAWAAHIATDRALGFGPRSPDGFIARG